MFVHFIASKSVDISPVLSHNTAKSRRLQENPGSLRNTGTNILYREKIAVKEDRLANPPMYMLKHHSS